MAKPSPLDTILESIDRLPPFPETARKILELSGDMDVDYREIIDVIKYDEAITSNCLKVCNSSYYGLRVKTFTVDQAVVILGIHNIQMIALASANGLSDYSNAHEGYRYGTGELWRHSVTTALISQLLFKGKMKQEGSILFTSALLHDMGKIVLNKYVAEEIGNLVTLAQRENLSLVEAERTVFGIDHAKLGGLIAEKWQFPSMLCKAIKNHHKSPDAFIPNIEAWVRLSSLVYHVWLANSVYSHRREIISRVRESILFQFSLKQKDIDQLTTELQPELKKIEGLLRLAF
ncbi:MAG: HDOD domain-containing protein [Deltaproteobacteria bacterium]|nr:HDOD domain-containing protein [Deltaproteobacteria bacterium]